MDCSIRKVDEVISNIVLIDFSIYHFVVIKIKNILSNKEQTRAENKSRNKHNNHESYDAFHDVHDEFHLRRNGVKNDAYGAGIYEENNSS